MRAGAERAEVTVEQVVRELKLLGFSDIRKVVSWRNELVTRTEKGKDGEPVMVMMPRVTIVDADKISSHGPSRQIPPGSISHCRLTTSMRWSKVAATTGVGT
jgi:hypothetical protein